MTPDYGSVVREASRAERGVDALEASTVTVSETIWTAVNRGTIAGVDVETTANSVLRGLVNDRPVRIAPMNEQDLAVFGNVIEQFTLHDALLVANHRVRGTEAIVTNDPEFAPESTVWD